MQKKPLNIKNITDIKEYYVFEEKGKVIERKVALNKNMNQTLFD